MNSPEDRLPEVWRQANLHAHLRNGIAAAAGPACTDSCEFADDLECDDGGVGSEYDCACTPHTEPEPTPAPRSEGESVPNTEAP